MIVTQTHYPGRFHLRIVGVDRDLEVNSEEDKDIDNTFLGHMKNMNVSGEKGKGKDVNMPDQTTS